MLWFTSTNAKYPWLTLIDYVFSDDQRSAKLPHYIEVSLMHPKQYPYAFNPPDKPPSTTKFAAVV
jgi:hypothetical protein